MKRSFVVLITLLSSLSLASCENGGNFSNAIVSGLTINISGPTTVEIGSKIKLNGTLTNDTQRLGFDISSSDETVATVDGQGYVTGVKTGSVIITATAAADSSITATYEVVVTESSLPSMSLSLDSSSVTLGIDSVNVRAELYNPTSFTPKIKWTTRYGKGAFLSNNAESVKYRPLAAGDEIIDVSVHIGPYYLVDSIHILTKANFLDGTWAAIETSDDFLSKLRKTSSVTGNFYLKNDIDLGGATLSPATGNIFAGVLDGNGHKISNFSVSGDSEGANGGLFTSVTGTIRNLAVEGEIPQSGSGWGTGLLTNTLNGTIENVFIDVNHSYDNGKLADDSGWLPFCGALSGVLQENAKAQGIVVNVQDTEGKATVYADTAYPAGFAGAQTFSVSNLYTNTSVVGGQTWDWGNAVADLSGYTASINWTNAEASTYDLNPDLWALADNTMPTLKVLEA